MSNAMSRSKSRWKGALLATVAGAVVSPLAAKASMTVGVYLAPLGQTGPYTTNYLTPDQNGSSIPLYVYATVTGTNAITPDPANGGVLQVSTGNFDGLQYLYYNVLASGGNAGGVTGGIASTTLNSSLGFDSSGVDQGSSNTSGGAGAQTGLIDLPTGSSLAAGSTVVALGASSAFNASSPVSSTAMTQFAKPRAGAPVWSNYAVNNASTGNTYTYLNDGKNIIIGTGSNGLATNQAAFLVETLSYTPSAFSASTPGSLNSVSFSIQGPYNTGGGSILNGTNYAPGNSFNDSTQSYTTYNSSSGSSISLLTSSNYSSGHSVTLTDTLLGDTNGDGKVNSTDLNTVLQDFGQPFTTWAAGNFVGSGNVNSTDLNDVLQFFGQNVGAAPADIAVDAAVLADPEAVSLLEEHGFTPVPASAVPEPGSLVLAGVGAVSLLGRSRKRRQS